MIKHLLRIVTSVHSEEPETAIQDNVVKHCRTREKHGTNGSSNHNAKTATKVRSHDRNCPSGATAATAESEPTIIPVTTAAC